MSFVRFKGGEKAKKKSLEKFRRGGGRGKDPAPREGLQSKLPNTKGKKV